MIYSHFAAALIAAAVSAACAWQVQAWRFDALDKQRIEAQLEQRRNNEKAASAASTAFEKDRINNETRTRTVYVKVEKIIDRPVYRSICVDADGLRLLNDQIRRADDAGEPGSPLPGPAAGG
ncbi:MAG: hypothetical protein I8H71_00460 [Xanthomonadaceae bacterium]|nr:hypothetical protein [Xanthomonadaceae bacterium]MBH2008145.1 hypothetical protein [Xanthomonadaceae bacterium]